MAHLLIVDDEPSICWGLAKSASRWAIASTRRRWPNKGWKRPPRGGPRRSCSTSTARHQRPGGHGPFPPAAGPVPIMIITAFGDRATAVEAVRHGAFEYPPKPFDLVMAQRELERAVEHGWGGS